MFSRSNETAGAATPVDAETVNWPAGWYVVQSKVTISGRVTATGDVHLILADGASLTVAGGIGLSGTDSNLTIYGQEKGTGELVASGSGAGRSGIGATRGTPCGDIAIHGGRVTASSSHSAAGIGAGNNSAGCGDIAIYGGSVTASGSSRYAAAIGAGNETACGDVAIYGGSVVASNGANARVIGAGPASGCCPSVTISAGASVIVFASDNAVTATNTDIDEGALLAVKTDGSAEFPEEPFTLAADVAIPEDRSLVVPSGGELFVPAGVTLTVDGDVTVQSGGKLTVEEGGKVVVGESLAVEAGGTYSGPDPETTGNGAFTVTYKVTLVLNGGAVAEGGNVTSYTYGTSATLPTDATREDYVFEGWYDNAELTGSAVSEIPANATGDKTFFAKWRQVVFSVTVRVEGDAGGTASASVEKQREGELVTLTAAPADGYHFVTWQVEPEAVTVGENGSYTLTMPSSDVTVTAVFGEHASEASYQHDADSHWQTCGFCGERFNEANHQPSDEYGGDTEGHWQLCDVCGAELSRAAHEFEWVVDKPATETEAGQRHEECTVCGFKGASEEIPVVVPEPEPGPGPAPAPDEDATVSETEGGTVEVEPAPAGESATIAVAPDEGQEVRDLIVTDAAGNPVEVAENPDGTFGFVMPEGGVTVEVVFGCDGGALCISGAFPDLDTSMWYHDAVDWALEGGVFHGYDDGTFGPKDALLREQAAAVLYNYLGGEPGSADPGLADVADDWYTEPVRWAAENGIMTGYAGTDLFGVGDALTREQFCSVIAKATGADLSAADLSVLDAFPDAADITDWARTAVAWAVENGVIRGVENADGTRLLQATRGLTRSEMAAMMNNAVEAGVLAR